ncbi:MAG TPA: hypothetical protein VE439_01685 [Anaerolineae bacterium]|nr:hypothetical protein [Anaerolineae bacterium]
MFGDAPYSLWLLHWYSGGKKTAEVFIHKDTGLISVRYVKGARRKYSERYRIFIPKAHLKAIDKATSKETEGTDDFAEKGSL